MGDGGRRESSERILYGTSAVLAMALVLAAFVGPVLALPLLVIAAILGVVINYFKGREINDWLEQCYFGIKEAKERFQCKRYFEAASTA